MSSGCGCLRSPMPWGGAVASAARCLWAGAIALAVGCLEGAQTPRLTPGAVPGRRARQPVRCEVAPPDAFHSAWSSPRDTRRGAEPPRPMCLATHGHRRATPSRCRSRRRSVSFAMRSRRRPTPGAVLSNPAQSLARCALTPRPTPGTHSGAAPDTRRGAAVTPPDVFRGARSPPPDTVPVPTHPVRDGSRCSVAPAREASRRSTDPAR